MRPMGTSEDGMKAPYEPRLIPAGYLARERAAETKSEYLDGRVIAMVGASRPSRSPDI